MVEGDVQVDLDKLPIKRFEAIDEAGNEHCPSHVDPESNLTAVEEEVTVPSVPLIDWDSIQIQEEMEEEGTIELCNEEQVYALLGFSREDERAEEIARDVNSNSDATRIPNVVESTEGASIPVEDYIAEETMVVYDKDNSSMVVGTIYLLKQ